MKDSFNCFRISVLDSFGIKELSVSHPKLMANKSEARKDFLKTQMKRSDFSFWSDFAIELTPLLGWTLKYILKKLFLCAGPQWCFHMFFQTSLIFFQFWRLERYTSISTDSNSLGPKCNGICMAKNIRKNIQNMMKPTWWSPTCTCVSRNSPCSLSQNFMQIQFQIKVSHRCLSDISSPSWKIFGRLVVPPNLLVSKNNKYFKEGLLLSWNLKHK